MSDTCGGFDEVAELTASRNRLMAEVAVIDRLVGALEAKTAEARRELARYQLGEQRGRGRSVPAPDAIRAEPRS